MHFLAPCLLAVVMLYLALFINSTVCHAAVMHPFHSAPSCSPAHAVPVYMPGLPVCPFFHLHITDHHSSLPEVQLTQNQVTRTYGCAIRWRPLPMRPGRSVVAFHCSCNAS